MAAPRLLPLEQSDLRRPAISVVMPTYNRADLFHESAKMVLNQSFQDIELVVSDDQSSDHTHAAAKALAVADARVRYHRTTVKGGVATAINEGIGLTRGDYIQICHDHDIYLPEFLGKLAGVLDRHPGVVFAHPGRQGCDHEGKLLSQSYFVCGYPEVSSGKLWKQRMLTRLASPVTALSMIRRTALEVVGLFDPDFGVSADVELWLRLCDVGDVGYINELLLHMRGREPGHPYGGANWQIIDEVIRAHRKHLPLAYGGLLYLYQKARCELEIDMSLLVDFLNSIRCRRWQDVANGRAYLRDHGPLISRAAGFLL